MNKIYFIRTLININNLLGRTIYYECEKSLLFTQLIPSITR